MTIKKIILQNYGVFGSRHVLDVTPRSIHRPVILFGGQNGSGKSTILEAIRLALHGRRALGNRVARKEYGSFLADRTHQGTSLRGGATKSLVEVEISHVQSGVSTDYSIVRSWMVKGSRTEDSLTVYKGGDILSSFERDQWQDFVEDLMPASLADLYFFDADRVEALANESTARETLAESVRSILGLDTIDRLTADLSLYLTRMTDGGNGDHLGRELSRLNEEVEGAERLVVRLREQRAAGEAEVCWLRARLERAKVELAAEGGSFSQKVDKISDRAKELDQEIEQLERVARTMCGELLPFAIAGSLLDCLERRLASDMAATTAQVGSAIATEIVDVVLARFRAHDIWKDIAMRRADIVAVVSTVEAMLAEVAKQHIERGGAPVTHGFGDSESAQILHWCSRLRGGEQQKFIGICARIRKLYEERRRCEQIVRAAPSDDVLAPFVDRLESAARRHAEVESRLRRIDERICSATIARERAARERKRTSTKLAQARDADRRVSFAGNSVGALAAYSDDLTRRKLLELENAFVDRFCALSRKTDLITHIEIHPKTYEVHLRAAGGRSLSAAQLSAGEKQLFAISMLWAMREVSGRPLPLVIDTPMGRLDSEHRGRLVSSYFPGASHQVLILSTDTEIDRSYFGKLHPHISKAFHLEYDPEQHRTSVSEGYFWRAGSRVVA